MVNFSDVVTLSRQAQQQQVAREEADLAFVQGVMQAVQGQVAAQGGEVTQQGEWGRLSENTVGSFSVKFPPGCNVEEVGLMVGGHVTPTQVAFLVGPAGRTPDLQEVRNHQGAVEKVMVYLLEVVQEVTRLHQRT